MRLDVLLHGRRVAELCGRREGGCTFAYDPAAIDGFGSGETPLSLALPPRHEPYSPDATRAFVEGHLPAGRRRRRIAHELGLDPRNGFALLAALGRDCPGAVVFLPEWEREAEGPAEPEWLSEDDLAAALASPSDLFARDRSPQVRFALPGQRHKLALVREPGDGRWAWPGADLPSTHVVKPEPADRPGIAALEAACTAAYRELGLPVAHAEHETIAGVPCLVSRRFDRWGEGAGAERLHAESLAQALGLSPDAHAGRLQAGAPSLAEAANLLRVVGEADAVPALLRAAVFDLVVGSAKMRGGDAAVLHTAEGPMLAPFWDIAPGEVYGETRPRPIAVGPDVPPAPFLVDLAHTFEQCGAEFQPALLEHIALFGPLIGAISYAAERAQREGWYSRAIDEGLQMAIERTRVFMEREVGYLKPPGVD